MTVELLRLIAPNRLVYGDRQQRIGSTVFLAIRAIRAEGGKLSLGALSLEVWSIPEATREQVWSLCHRINLKLKGVGFPGRCGVDAGEVMIV